MELTQDVQEIVERHAPHFCVEGGKIKCNLNGHTFPPKAEVLSAFINGKKFTKLLKQAELDAGLAKYEPFIVRSKNLPGALFCALTGELLNAKLEDVKKHLKGKKFAGAKEHFEADELELLEEPHMEPSDMEEDGPEGSDGPGFWVPEEVLEEHEMEDAEEEEEQEEEEQDGDEEDAAAMDEEGRAAGSKKGGSRGGSAEQPKPPLPQQQKEVKASDTRKAKKAAAGSRQTQQQDKAGSSNGKPSKQRQQQPKQAKAAAAATANGTGGSGKAKPPKAKRARTN